VTLRESPVPGPVPLYELSGWRERYGIVAGITGRSDAAGGGFDLGLWSASPVGETMSRWRAFRRAMQGFGAVVLGNQVHGVEVMAVDAAVGWVQVEGIDGWTTSARGVLLTVTIADCIPVYLAVPGRGVALLHAGWRGTAGGILHRGVSRLSGTTGASPREMIMHCGVGICGDCYEVGVEVMERCGVRIGGPGPFHLDLRGRLLDEAHALGLEAITSSTWCSAHDHDRFYSHRRSRGADGRMAAYAGMLR
jgi:polyphenol oxidase